MTHSPENLAILGDHLEDRGHPLHTILPRVDFEERVQPGTQSLPYSKKLKGYECPELGIREVHQTPYGYRLYTDSGPKDILHPASPADQVGTDRASIKQYAKYLLDNGHPLGKMLMAGEDFHVFPTLRLQQTTPHAAPEHGVQAVHVSKAQDGSYYVSAKLNRGRSLQFGIRKGRLKLSREAEHLAILGDQLTELNHPLGPVLSMGDYHDRIREVPATRPYWYAKELPAAPEHGVNSVHAIPGRHWVRVENKTFQVDDPITEGHQHVAELGKQSVLNGLVEVQPTKWIKHLEEQGSKFAPLLKRAGLVALGQLLPGAEYGGYKGSGDLANGIRSHSVAPDGVVSLELHDPSSDNQMLMWVHPKKGAKKLKLASSVLVKVPLPVPEETPTPPTKSYVLP